MFANVLSATMGFLTPDLIAKMASASGLDRAVTRKTVEAAVPAVLSGLAHLAASAEGARQLSSVIAEQPQNLLANLSDMFGGTTRIKDTGKNLLSSLLGATGLNALASGIGTFAGVNAGSTASLLGMLAPVVLGILGRMQREDSLSTSGLGQRLTAQKDDFIAAMPAGLSEQLQRSGFFDRIGAQPAAPPGRSEVRATAPVRTAQAPAMNWAYWLLPLAALAGLGWYLLSGDRTRREEAVRTSEAPETTMQPLRAASVNESDIGRQLTDAINALQGHLQGVRDAGAAVALPKLRETSGQLDRLTELASQLPTDARERVASAIKEGRAKVKSTLDSVGAIANATPGLVPALDALRSKLDALADGRVAYFAKGPADSLSLTAYLSRDVYNRAGEKIGAINDFLVAPDGRITAVIIGVGGFLGMGEKEIALPFSSIQSVRRDDAWNIVIDADKAALRDAPTFEPTGERLRFKRSPRQ
jgi:sporulation protein YlmC with PRC-barrel domain